MRKILWYGPVALFATGLVGCTNELTSQRDADKGQQITIVGAYASATDENGTRIYTQDGKTYWYPGNKSVGIFIDNEDIRNIQLSGTAQTGGSEFVEFNGNLGTTLPDGEYDIYGYYPYSDIDNSVQNSESAHIDVPAIQHPVQTSYDPTSAVLVTRPAKLVIEGGVPQDVVTQFEYAVAVANIVFDDVADKTNNEPIRQLTITTENNIAGQAELDLTTDVFGNWFSSENASHSITAITDNDDNITLNGQNGIMISLVPTTLAAGGTVIITAETDNYVVRKTITLPKETTFTAGQLKTLKISEPTVLKLNPEPIYHEHFEGNVDGIGRTTGGNTTTYDSNSSLLLPYTFNSEGGIQYRDAGQTGVGGVFQAGAAVRLGTSETQGESITTIGMDLSQPFIVKVIAKGWQSNGTLTVTADKQTANNPGGANITGTPASAIVVGSGSGTQVTGEWVQYIFTFENGIPNGLGKALTFTSSQPGDARIFIDDIEVLSYANEVTPYLIANADKSLLDVAHEGTHGFISINSNTAWNISITSTQPAGDISWLSTHATSGSNNSAVQYDISENTTTSTRSGFIIISNNETEVQIEVNQRGETAPVIVEAPYYLISNLSSVPVGTASYQLPPYTNGTRTNAYFTHTNELSPNTHTTANWILTKGRRGRTNNTIELGDSNWGSSNSVTASINTALGGNQYRKHALVGQTDFAAITKVEFWCSSVPATTGYALIYSTDGGMTWNLVDRIYTSADPAPTATSPRTYTFATPLNARFALVYTYTAQTSINSAGIVMNGVSLRFYNSK